MNSPQPTSTEFLTLEESNLVDQALLANHEKFLARLTVSSLKMLTHIASDLSVPIEALTANQIVAWFEQDSKIRREQGADAAFLKW